MSSTADAARRPLRVLLVEDEPLDVEPCVAQLRRAGFDVDHRRVDDGNSFRSALTEQDWDLVLSDFTLPQFDALRALEIRNELAAALPFLVVTGTIDEETAVECLKRGADDYILKENLVRLGPAVEQALALHDERRERSRLEAEVRQAQKMEAVGQLASGVAHDFNNLLTAIFGYADLARLALPADHPAAESLSGLESAARRATGVIRGLLTFSRKEVAQKEPADLTSLIRDAVGMLRRVMPASIEIVVEVDGDEPLWVEGDSTQLHQVFMNLAINARDAMPGGGVLTVRLSSAGERAERVRLTVTDTGSGVREDLRDRVFEPFFTTKPAQVGTGLGLSIAYGIVTDHDGSIAVGPGPDGGATFTVEIPRIAPGSGTETGPSSVSTTGRGELILLAEDDEHVRTTVGASLQTHGYSVVQAGDGPTFLERRRELGASVRLLLLDVDMPGKSGLDCLDELRASGDRTPAILMTGSPPPRATEPSDVLLKKPLRSADLVAHVARLLAGGAASGVRSPGSP